MLRHGRDERKQLDNQLFAVGKVRQGAAYLNVFQGAGGGMRYEV